MVDQGTAFAIFFLVVFGVPLAIIFLYCLFRFRVVEKETVMIVERWGRFHRQCNAGLHFLMPFADQPRTLTWRDYETKLQGNRFVQHVHQVKMTRIDLRESILDFPSQSIITRDNVEIQVHPMVLYRIAEPIRAVYETFDLSHAVEKLVQTTLRSIIGDMGLDDTLASREEINRGLMQKIHNVCLNWGVSITKVELLEITPTATVQNAMHKQLEAERVRRASIVEADGLREQTKTMAEGECQAQIAIARGQAQVKVLRARGKADKKRLLAQAEARAVNTIAAAVAPFDVNPTHYLVALRYIDTFLKVASNAQKRSLYFPCQTDVVGSLSALSAQ